MRILACTTLSLVLSTLLAAGQGEIIPRVTCHDDTAQHYAVFVPSGYTDTVSWPVIFFFEPGARAMLPLERYADLAARFGYFLCCSYNSRNGPNEPIFRAANAMYADAFERYSLDREQVCLAGFSGGARISCLIAGSNTDMHSVIGCGAGFPFSEMPGESITFGYCGIIGKQDMNYQEMLLLDSVLSQRNSEHMLLTFSQGHRWPDTTTFRSAFFWLVTRAMRNGQRPVDEGLLESVKTEYDAMIDTLSRGNDPLGLARTLNNAILLLTGLRDVTSYHKGLQDLVASKGYQDALEAHYSTVETESSLHQKYWSEFEQISLRALDPDHPVRSGSWWKKEFRRIDGLEDPDLRARLHEFVVNGSWEQHINSLRADRYVVALSYLDVYEAGLPEDPSPDYYRARVYALSGDPASMYHYLENSIKKGSYAAKRIGDDEAFTAYLGQGRMQRLLEGMELKNAK